MDPNTPSATPQQSEPTPETEAQSAQQNPAASPTGSQQLPSAVEQEDPGKVLAIISLVVGIFVWSLIGLILAIIARNKSKAAGINGGISLIAFIVNLVLVILSVLAVIAIIVIFVILGSSGAMNASNIN